MRKKISYIRKYMLKAALGIGASFLLISSLSLIHNNKFNNINNSTSTNKKEVLTNINSSDNTNDIETKSTINQKNSLTTTCNYSETNDYSISAFKSQYAYQWSNNASYIGDFIFENINILFTNTRNIVRSDIVIQDELTKINDKKGEVIVSLYLKAWHYEGQLVYTPSQTFTIKFSGFKILSNSYADPSIRNLYQTYFKFKDITHSAFPSSILEKLLALNGNRLDDRALKVLNEYLYMGPIPNAINDFVFEISGDANNLTGSLNLVIKLNYILTSDKDASYTKILKSNFNKKPFIFTINLVNTTSKKYFTNVGISSLSQTILNVNSLASISQKYNVSSFIFDLKNTGLQEVLKSEIAKLVKHDSVRYKSSDISFNLNELSSNVSAGIVTIPVTISNFYTINSSLDKTFNFTFMVEPTSTPVFLKSNSFPMLMDVNEAIERIQQDIKSKKNFEEQTFIRQFLNVSNINFKNTKVIEIRTTNLNSVDNSVSINFKFSNVTTINNSGEVTTGDVWTNSFNYKFYKESRETSIINPIKLNSSIKFENNSVSDVYPYVVANQSNYTFIKEIIVNQGTINKPGTVLPDKSVSVEYNTSNVFITKATPNNKTGEILVEGYLNKYLVEENNQLVCKENGKLTFTTTINGFKNIQSYTSISRNPTYKNEYANTLPSAFANDVNKGIINNDVSLVKKFLLIYYHPYTSLDDGSINNDQKFKNTKLEIIKFDDKKGTIDIKFTIDGKFNNDNSFSYSSNTWTSDVISFNFFKVIDEPTQIENEINDTNAIYNKYSAIGALTAINNINNRNWQSTSDDNLLYNTIKELLAQNLHFVPNNFTSNNIKELNAIDYDNDNKWIDIELKLDFYINDKGETVGPLSDLENLNYGTFKTRLNANFRNVERTEFNTGPFFVPNVSIVNASDWLKVNNDPAIDYLYNAYLNNNSPKVLKGDIPGLGNNTNKIQRSDIIIENIVADDNTASVTVEASLKKYWQYNTITNKNEIVSNNSGYTPKTKITFIGFMSPGTTILPISTEYEVDSTLSKYYASDLDSVDSEEGINSDKFTLSKLKKFIFGTYDDTGDENTNDSYGESTSGLITGKKLNMSWQDVDLYLDKNDTQTTTTSNIFGITYQLEPNDLEGTLVVRGELKKQWYLNFETGNKVLGQAPEGRREFSFTLKGFQKKQPTNVNTSINSGLVDKYASDVSISEIEKIITEKGFSGSLPTSDIAKGRVWELIKSSRQNNNRDGTITIELKLNAKYDASNSLLYSTYIDNTLDANNYTIVIKNFNKSEPTTFIKENIFKIDQYNNILNNSAQTVSSVIKGEIQNNDLIEELKNVIYNDIIASGKMRITNDDIELESISHDNKIGSLTIKVKLKKYWNNNCDWIDTTISTTAPVLEKQITFTTFKITGQTKVDEQTPINASKSILFNNLTSDVFAKLINEKNQQYLQEAMKMIWNENVVNYQDSYTDGMSYEHIEIISADASGNLLTLGQAKVTFKFNDKGYWNDDFDFIKQESKEFTVLFINFKKVVGTTLIQGEKLINDKIYNSVGSKFDEGDKEGNEGALQFKPNNNISKLTPSQWVEECQKASTTNNPDEYLTQLINFIFYNKEEFIINPPISDFSQNNIILKKIKFNDEQGTIECSFTINKYIDHLGNLKDEPMNKVTVTFKQFMKQEGTKYTDNTTIDITEYEDLFNYVTTKKIEASQITGSYEFIGAEGLLVNGTSDTKLTELVRKILLEKGLTGFVPQFDSDSNKNITWENICFSQIESNKFNRSITLKFWTNRYYVVGSNSPVNEKLGDGKEITLINFYPSSGQETIIKDLSAKISTFNDSSISGGINSWFVDPNGLGIYTPDVASDANSNEVMRLEARENFKKWIFDKAVSGNKDGLSWEDVDITSGYDNYNILNGTLTLTFRLKKYWTTSGPSNNYSPIYTVNLSNFKTQKPTSVNDVIFNLTNYSEQAPNYGKYIANIIDKIKSNTSAQILDQYRAELEEYLIDYIAWNAKDIFKNLPLEINNLNNPEFYNKFKNCFSISIIIADEQSSTINVSVQLKYYVDEYGEVQGNINGTSNTSKNFNITFSGFKTLRPTSIPNQLNIINVAKNGGQTKFNYYEQMLSTTYADGSQYYWYSATPENIYDEIVSAAPISSNMTISDARNDFTKTIINWINSYAVDNPAFTNKIETVTIKNINYNNSQGVIYIEYSVNYGYEKDVNGNYVETTLKSPLQGSLRLEGFQTKSILNTSSVKTILALGLSAFGVFLFLIIILIILFKRKRDIEYRQ